MVLFALRGAVVIEGLRASAITLITKFRFYVQPPCYVQDYNILIGLQFLSALACYPYRTRRPILYL